MLVQTTEVKITEDQLVKLVEKARTHLATIKCIKHLYNFHVETDELIASFGDAECGLGDVLLEHSAVIESLKLLFKLLGYELNEHPFGDDWVVTRDDLNLSLSEAVEHILYPDNLSHLGAVSKIIFI